MEQLLQEPDDSYSLVSYYPKAISSHLLQKMKTYCANTPDYQGGTTNFGTDVPRLQKWYQEDLGYFSDRWRQRHARWEAFPYDSVLHEIQNEIKQLTDKYLHQYPQFQTKPFNSCLLNYYLNETNSIRAHSDDEPTFGHHPTVAITSVGTTRDIVFQRKVPGSAGRPDKRYTPFRISLEEGSLLLMAGSTQTYYLHEIPKETVPCGPRHSMTFRHYQCSN